MENIHSPIRKFQEIADKCSLEYETLYNNSRLSMNEEHYNQFSRLLMYDSASDADDEITDTSHEELNSLGEVYKPKNVYSIAGGDKPFTLILKKQQSSDNIKDVSYTSREAQIITNSGIINDKFPLHNIEDVNNTLGTMPLDHVHTTEEKRQSNEIQNKPKNTEGMSVERKTFPLQDFNRFCDETSNIFQKISDPAISGYEVNCESEGEVSGSHTMLECNGSNVEDPINSLMNQHYDSGSPENNSVVKQDNVAKLCSSMSSIENVALNKDKELNGTAHCSSINDGIFYQSCTHEVNEPVNKDMYSANESNAVEVNKNTHASDNVMESFTENSCILDYSNNEQSIKINEIADNDRSGKEIDGAICKTLEIIENECEITSGSVHKTQVKITTENEMNSGAFHESKCAKTNEQDACSLDVTENSKRVQTDPHYESEEDLQMHEFDSEEHTERSTVIEQSEEQQRVSDINFLNKFETDHVVLSLQKSSDSEKITQNEIVNPVDMVLKEEENNILEGSTDKYQSEAATAVDKSEISLSNMSPAAEQKENDTKALEPLEKSYTLSKLETKGKDDIALLADSFADDTMDCSYNDSSSCLDRSPLLFSSDEENYYYTEDSVAADTSKCYESENQTQQERRKLRRLQHALAGVPPPPSITIPQLDVNEILKLIKENQKLMNFDDNTEEKEGSSDGKEHKRPLTLFGSEEVKNLPWPEAKSSNFYGIQYNNGKLSEELEALYERLRDRYVGCETLSSCNIWFPGITKKAIEKKMKKRNIGQSPGRRLSHLAKRRQVFSSANLLPSVAGSLPTAAARRGCNRLIMVEVKKGDHRTKAKGQQAKKATLNGNNKLQQTKRALFKSPPNGRKKISSASKNKSSSKKIKREVDRSKICNSKRALWPSSGKSENIVPDSSSRQFKRPREESEDEGKLNKFPRRSLFGDREREKESNNPKLLHTNSSNSQILSQQHKKKLLWAVAETLRTKGVSMNHPSFKTLASSLARKVCSSLPDMSKRREGKTSEFMLQVSREHVDNILKTTALQDKTELIKD